MATRRGVVARRQGCGFDRAGRGPARLGSAEGRRCRLDGDRRAAEGIAGRRAGAAGRAAAVRPDRLHLHDHRSAAGDHPHPGAHRQPGRLVGGQHAAVRWRAGDRCDLRDLPVLGLLPSGDRHFDPARRGVLDGRQGAAADGRPGGPVVAGRAHQSGGPGRRIFRRPDPGRGTGAVRHGDGEQPRRACGRRLHPANGTGLPAVDPQATGTRLGTGHCPAPRSDQRRHARAAGCR